jgi:hypothetical protein
MKSILLIALIILCLVFLILGFQRKFRHQWPQWLFWLLSLACVLTATLIK